MKCTYQLLRPQTLSAKRIPIVVPWEIAMKPLMRPPRGTHIRIVCISDTHNHHRHLTRVIPPCDLLIHAGDISENGSAAEINDFCAWLRRDVPWVGARVLIAGNHDLSLDKKKHLSDEDFQPLLASKSQPSSALDSFWTSFEGSDDALTNGKELEQRKATNAERQDPIVNISKLPYTRYLVHEFLTLELPSENDNWKHQDSPSSLPCSTAKNKITLFGSPFSLCDNGAESKHAFPVNRDKLREEMTETESACALWDRTLTEKLDILITHGPPFGIRDVSNKGKHNGCTALRDWTAVNVPRVHVFGHYHASYGTTFDGTTLFVNACNCNSKCDPRRLNKPIVIDLPLL
eukprot:GILI01017894.1.p1 GENE.GILI01017894.1~~GILI01017894.1.p1  ORF type:complete len:347 (-),score=15.96 GILI01017894.1:26-1066(-)